jgi:hypothetical protein
MTHHQRMARKKWKGKKPACIKTVEEGELFRRTTWTDMLNFEWVAPIMSYAKLGYTLRPHHLQNIHQNQRHYGKDKVVNVEVHVAILKKCWSDILRESPAVPSPNALNRAIQKAFRVQIFTLTILNAVTTLLNLLGPLLIKALIEYVKTGEIQNDLKWVHDLMGISSGTEYAYILVAFLVLSQGFSYFLRQHVKFHEELMSAVCSATLTSLIHEKILKVSPSTNKTFKSGELMTFVSVDAQKASFVFI